MKRFIISIFIILITSALCLTSSIIISKSHTQALEMCEKMEDFAENENFYECKNIYEELDTWWQKRKKLLLVVTEHEHLVEMDAFLSQTRGAILASDKAELLICLNAFKNEIEAMYDNDRFTLTNIL